MTSNAYSYLDNWSWGDLKGRVVCLSKQYLALLEEVLALRAWKAAREAEGANHTCLAITLGGWVGAESDRPWYCSSCGVKMEAPVEEHHVHTCGIFTEREECDCQDEAQWDLELTVLKSREPEKGTTEFTYFECLRRNSPPTCGAPECVCIRD